MKSTAPRPSAAAAPDRPEAPAPVPAGLSARALLLGILAVAAVCLVIGYAELVIKYIQLGILQLPPVVIGCFLMLTLANRGLQRVSKRWALSSQELTIIYAMMLLGAMVASRGLVEKVLPLLVTPDYFSNEANQWQETYFPYIPRWWVPFDPTGNSGQWVSKRFFEGLRYGEKLPWGLWVVPLAAWSLLALSVFGMFFCLAALLRRQWADHERLSFPLVQLPLEMVRQETGFLSNPFTWMGAGLAASVFLVRGLHAWYPQIPDIPLDGYALNDWFTEPPWRSMSWTPIFASLAGVGFLYLLPSELLFSLWFFYLFTRVQDVILASFGVETQIMPLYGCSIQVGHQIMGAYVVIVGYLVYSSWPYLKGVFARALHGSSQEDSRELLTPRAALVGLAVCFSVAVCWCIAAGMTPWLAVMVLGLYAFFIAMLMTRSTAEAGLLMTETSFRPVDMFRLFAPTHALGHTNMTLLAFLDPALFRDQRGLVLTGFLDGLKLGDGVGLSRRKLGVAFVVALLTALLVAGAFELWLPYSQGSVTLYDYVYRANNQWGFQDYSAPMSGPIPYNWTNRVWFGVGIVVTVALAILRTRFAWWPFHPLGYALCGTWSILVFWFPCLIAWILKTVILRYGGMRTYVRLRPFFLGLVLGEFGMAVLWTLVSAAFQVPAPNFPWP
ncbi:MAG TPA: DUF6785 family protein [Armatimonadota bacterium]|jgi:hypothetical protein